MDIRKAIREGDITTVDMYLKSGGRTDLPFPLLFNAIKANNVDILLLLICFNADLNILISPSDEESNAFYPLYAAVTVGGDEIINTLLIHGANPNSKNLQEQTPLHKAAEHDLPKILELLLLYGADRSIKDTKGDTALDIALRFSNIECVAVLVGDEATNSSIEKESSGSVGQSVGQNFEMQKKEIDAEINNLNDKKRKLSIPSEKRKTVRASDEMKIIKKTISENLKKVNEINQTISKTFSEVKDHTKDIIAHNSKTLLLIRSKVGGNSADREFKDYECPICFKIPLPPLMVYQCFEGHILCSTCKDNPMMTKCPQCEQPIKDLKNRCRVMEKLIEPKFGY